MIAIDTNILIRFFINDNQTQSHKSLALINNHDEIFISTIVLCEAIWVLMRRYGLEKSDAIHLVEQILRVRQFIVEHADAIKGALNVYKNNNIGLADCILASVAQSCGYAPTMTFDKKAAKTDLFKLVV